jgi:hypothetical protein
MAHKTISGSGMQDAPQGRTGGRFSAPTALARPRIEYYAWRHLPLAQFEGLNVLVTLFDTLTHIPETVSDPLVARQKLAFFQADIAAATRGAAQHPEVQALAALLKKYPLDLTPFDELYIAIETDIDRIQSIDDNDLNRYCKRKRGSLLLLCAQFLKQSPLTEHEKKDVEALGVFIERVILLQIKGVQPEKNYLFSIQDFVLENYVAVTTAQWQPTNGCLKGSMYILGSLYRQLLVVLAKTLHDKPDERMTLNPIYLLLLSIFYRYKDVM